MLLPRAAAICHVQASKGSITQSAATLRADEDHARDSNACAMLDGILK